MPDRTADYVIQKAYLAAQRKAVPPATGTTKYNVLLGLLDSAQDDWRNEASIEWNSLYQTVNNGTISTSDTYDLDDSIDFISKRDGDSIYLSKDGHKYDVPLVTPDQLYQQRYILAVAKVGRELRFSKPFLSTDQYIGYTLNIPAYIYTDDITSGNSTIQCDDPMYLAYMLAAEFSRTDVVKGGQYNLLLDKAAERMEKMKQNNDGQHQFIVREPLQYGEQF